MTASGGWPAASKRGAAFFGIGDDEIGDALDQRVREPRFDRQLAPGKVGPGVLGLAFLDRLREFDQRFAGLRRFVEHDVFHFLAQRRVEVVVDADHAGVDDAHRQPGPDGVIEENGVDRLAHRRRCRGS